MSYSLITHFGDPNYYRLNQQGGADDEQKFDFGDPKEHSMFGEPMEHITSKFLDEKERSILSSVNKPLQYMLQNKGKPTIAKILRVYRDTGVAHLLHGVSPDNQAQINSALLEARRIVGKRPADKMVITQQPQRPQRVPSEPSQEAMDFLSMYPH